MAGDAGAALAELERTIRRFGEAWACGDVAVLDELLSPTYTHIDAYGDFHDRTSWLAYAAGRAGRTTRIALRDLATRLIGEVAVVTGVNGIPYWYFHEHGGEFAAVVGQGCPVAVAVVAHDAALTLLQWASVQHVALEQ